MGIHRLGDQISNFSDHGESSNCASGRPGGGVLRQRWRRRPRRRAGRSTTGCESVRRAQRRCYISVYREMHRPGKKPLRTGKIQIRLGKIEETCSGNDTDRRPPHRRGPLRKPPQIDKPEDIDFKVDRKPYVYRFYRPMLCRGQMFDGKSPVCLSLCPSVSDCLWRWWCLII